MIALLAALLGPSPLVGAAWAGEPTRLGTTLAIGSDVRQLAATEDGLWIALVDGGSGALVLVDTASFLPYELAACAEAGGVATDTPSGGGYRFWVGCGDGSVTMMELDAAGNAALASYEVAGGPIRAIETDGVSVFVAAEEDSSLRVYGLDADSGAALTGGGWGGSLASDQVEDTVLLDGRFVVIHGGDNVSWVDTSTGNASSSQENLGGRDFVDGAAYGATNVYLADASGAVVRFDPSTEFSILLDDVATTVTGVAVVEEEGFLAVATGDEVRFHTFSGTPGAEIGAVEGVGDVGDMVYVDGYLYGVDAQDQLVVLTDRPWVEAGDPSPESAVAGDEVTFSFTADVDGAWTVVVGGTALIDGVEVASGTLTAGEEISASVVVDDAFAEGLNRVWIFVEAGGLVGHDAVVVTVDNPPSVVRLTEGDVGFGDESVLVSFDGIDDADLASYTVYLSGEPFTAGDWPTGGPAFTGPTDDLDRVGAPATVAAAPGEPVDVSFSHLLNGTTYYVAVRATDANGNEGPMSDVIAATPQETWSASELRGDPGGYCASAPARTGVLLLAAGLAATLLRRRGAALAGAGLLVGLGAGEARAAEPETEKPRFHAQISGGLANLADPYVQDVFGDWNVMARGSYGVTTRLVELDLGAGYHRAGGYLLTADGGTSNEDTHLTIFPLSLSATLRLDFFREQLIVPAAGVGGDYWMWKEKWWTEDEDEDSARSGGKLGWHWNAGGWLLLDPLDRSAASALEAKTGIDDTFLTFEYRQTYMKHSDKLLDFSDKEFLVGLKCDF